MPKQDEVKCFNFDKHSSAIRDAFTVFYDFEALQVNKNTF